MKPIKLTEKMIEEMKAEIMKKIEEDFAFDKLKADAESCLAKAKMADGSFKFKKALDYEKKFVYQKSERRAKITILPEAYAKMITIIMTQTKEVAWHGVTERISATEFLIKDVMVYPQKVTAVTVDTDDEEYTKWMFTLDDEVFNNMHFQGHSHVDMAVTPSTTDMGHREKITSQLTDEDYYIFMIWNKRLQWSAGVYDMPSNTLYETDDIDVEIDLGDMTAGQLLQDLNVKVVQSVSSYGAPKNGSTPLYPVYGGANKNQESKPNPVKEEKAGGNVRSDFPRYQGSAEDDDLPYQGASPYRRPWWW